MSKKTGLGKQLAWSMVTVVMGTTTLSILGFWFYGSILAYISPAALAEAIQDPTDLTPSWVDMVIIGVVTIFAIIAAIWGSMRIAKRVLAPLGSLAESVASVAEGDLTARAVAPKDAPGEAAHLVENFNILADRLQKLAAEQSMWNASIAHELRTPITILRGRLQGLAEGVFAPEEGLFRNLLGQVEGLSRLIEDLRVVSLVDSGYLELHPERVDLDLEIREFSKLLQPELTSAGIGLTLSITRQRVNCDIVRIRQMLLILIENARLHAKPKLINVKITLDTSNVLGVDVTDNGSGLPDHLASTIFEAFVKGSKPVSGKRTGSGLGLAVVRAIALAHGGSAHAKNLKTGGTCFSIQLPLADNATS
ncbi:HAMP domain-containing histidine kinase [Pantoea sp. Tr-811]|uniref:ATP-binding protein n=1 Tax=Pantoea sp. Tr-811 TaxID=2608361 RepID=UPI00141FC5EE|nr:ATP-binding protein [Pantoea sp. Tr-811]NIF29487.1 HAMP domain-containing histidine kinase [Pantoea sp. Tr-811]